MKGGQLNLIYASMNGTLIHISQVESGLQCNCTCPSCGARLVARKGSKVMHHFAHYNSESCEYGYETSLHLAAKEVIANAKRIWIPEVKLNFDSGKQESLCKSTEIQIDDVRLEKAIDNIVPDIVVISRGKTLIIEIYVTHPIDGEKLQKIRELNLSTIEIDLSKRNGLISRSELEDIIIGNSPEKCWKYNSMEELWKRRYIKVSDTRKIIARGYAFHIQQCPISIRTWRGISYANFIHNCITCTFFLAKSSTSYTGDNDHGTILCSGRERIATIEDFALAYEERRRRYDSAQELNKRDAIMANRCPNCDGYLIYRNGSYGEFWGCSNYPHCRFTMNADPETGELITKA